jgi:hypothetical protein
MAEEKVIVVPAGSSTPGVPCNSELANAPAVQQVVVVETDGEDEEEE